MSIGENVRLVQQRIAQAAQRSGRSPDGISMVAVTKGADVPGIREAFIAGVTHFGENRVQEALRKLEALKDLRPQITWHMVGHLQTNKAKVALRNFDIIQSLDSVPLGELLDRQAEAPAPVFLEVNVSGEATKYGFTPEELPEAFQCLSHCSRLEIRGLMTVAPLVADTEEVRPVFRRLRELARSLRLAGLSMGMSHDFEVAVEEGATVVRIGTAIFHRQKERGRL